MEEAKSNISQFFECAYNLPELQSYPWQPCQDTNELLSNGHLVKRMFLLNCQHTKQAACKRFAKTTGISLRRPVGYLSAFGFFRLPRGVPRRLLSEAYQSSQRSIPTTVKSGSSTI
jgi:hypothetical protein